MPEVRRTRRPRQRPEQPIIVVDTAAPSPPPAPVPLFEALTMAFEGLGQALAQAVEKMAPALTAMADQFEMIRDCYAAFHDGERPDLAVAMLWLDAHVKDPAVRAWLAERAKPGTLIKVDPPALTVRARKRSR